MNSIVQAITNKEVLTAAAIGSVAFLIALPVGASLTPNASAGSAKESVSRVVGCVEGAGAAISSATTSRGHVSGANTSSHSHTHTFTQTSSNNSGSTAQVGGNGIAAAVTVGDVLSNNNVLSGNNVSVPVLSNNTTTVSPTVNLLNDSPILNKNQGALLNLGILSL